MKKFFRKYFRRDNCKFMISWLTSLFGFIFTNIPLIAINDFLNPLTIFLTIICVSSLVILLVLSFHKYQYYRGLIEHLQQKDKQLFLICSYISKARKRRDKNKVNNFSVRNMNIAYDINVPRVFTVSESKVDFTVTYKITAINNGANCSRIYHSSLSQGNGDSLDAKYSFDGRNWFNLSVDSFFKGDKNYQLWYAIKDGKPIARNQEITYWIKFTYKKGYDLLKGSCFLIDPQNYAETVERITLNVCSKTEELGKLINYPIITTYHNGLNMNERTGQSLFVRGFDAEYKTFFSHIVSPRTNDTIYVFELSPKQVD